MVVILRQWFDFGVVLNPRKIQKWLMRDPKPAKGSKKGSRDRGDSHSVSALFWFSGFCDEKAVLGLPKA